MVSKKKLKFNFIGRKIILNHSTYTHNKEQTTSIFFFSIRSIMNQYKTPIALDHYLSLKITNIFRKFFLENNYFYVLINEIGLKKNKIQEGSNL